MTAKAKTKGTFKKRARLPISEFVLFLSLFAVIGFSDTLSTGAKKGLVLTAGTILPSIFPFMVLGDFISYYISKNGLGIFEGALCRIFGISRGETAIFGSGLLCGFPASAVLASRAYKDGSISKSRATTVSALSSNPSPTFIIGAVGGGLLNDEKAGMILLLSLFISVIITRFLFPAKRQKNQFPDIIFGQKYSFVSSVKNAGAVSVTVFSFISIFCALIELIKLFIGEGVFFSLLVPFTEVSTAVVHLSSKCALPKLFINLLLGFSIGFGGISANLQCIAFLAEAGLKAKRFLAVKLCLGLICAVVTALCLHLYSIL